MFSLSLALPMLFTMLIHAADSLSYALRLGGLRTRRIALAISLAGILLLVSRTSNMAQGPMIGSLVNAATRGNNPHFAAQLHWLMGAAAAESEQDPQCSVLHYPAILENGQTFGTARYAKTANASQCSSDGNLYHRCVIQFIRSVFVSGTSCCCLSIDRND